MSHLLAFRGVHVILIGGLLFRFARGCSLRLTGSSVTQNHANGSPGLGGGVFTLGTFSDDASTVIVDNHASTGDNNFGP
jgi:hypothetical protein